MSTVAEEHVLVVPTEEFHRLGHFQGFSPDVDRYLGPILAHDGLGYRPRGAMEENPSFKQLIPYVLFRYVDGDGTEMLFQYTRGGGQGEARLHAKRSVGVGGHISSLDAAAGDHGDVYREGMRRELDEEVFIDCECTERCVGMINDDQTEVGRVHLGVVHLMDVTSPDVRPREEDIVDAGFRPVDDILRDREHFETWSQIVLDALFG